MESAIARFVNNVNQYAEKKYDLTHESDNKDDGNNDEIKDKLEEINNRLISGQLTLDSVHNMLRDECKSDSESDINIDDIMEELRKEEKSLSALGEQLTNVKRSINNMNTQLEDKISRSVNGFIIIFILCFLALFFKV
jgi:chemotaxis protein CheY-P-specific phosphatase CheC